MSMGAFYLGIYGSFFLAVGYCVALFERRPQRCAKFMKKVLKPIFDEYEFLLRQTGLEEKSFKRRVILLVEIYKYLDSVIDLGNDAEEPEDETD